LLLLLLELLELLLWTAVDAAGDFSPRFRRRLPDWFAPEPAPAPLSDSSS
jgi:hypothetical protein